MPGRTKKPEILPTRMQEGGSHSLDDSVVEIGHPSMSSLNLEGQHRIVIVALPPVIALDVTGPLDVFSMANALMAERGKTAPYELRLASPHGEPIATTAGMKMLADCALLDGTVTADTVLVAGGPGARKAPHDPVLMDGLRSLCGRTRRVGSICTGAFALAGTGLLDHKRATTHWAHFDEFASMFPLIELDRDALFVDVEPCHTSAGISAGIDYALALIESDLGRSMALDVARNLVVFLKRPGGQAQFSAQLAVQSSAVEMDRFDELNRWLQDNLALELTVDLLAERVAMSPRNFARRFVEKMGMAPARYVELLRVDAARRMLTDTDLPLARVAQRCGFGSAETMRQAFHRHISSAPGDFRARFQSTRASDPGAAARPAP